MLLSPGGLRSDFEVGLIDGATLPGHEDWQPTKPGNLVSLHDRRCYAMLC